MMSHAIECRDLRKTYDGKVEAVRGLDLQIGAGECFGLLGPNGAGKTTTIEILEGLLQPTSGTVTILGHHWTKNSLELRELLGISLQETKLSEKLTVRETVELFASFYRQPRATNEVLEQLQLTEKADSWVGKLSGGNGNVWRSPQRWLGIQRFCFWMNQPLGSTHKADGNCGTSFGRSRVLGEQFCLPHTIWMKRNGSATGLRLSITGRSSRRVHQLLSLPASVPIMSLSSPWTRT